MSPTVPELRADRRQHNQLADRFHHLEHRYGVRARRQRARSHAITKRIAALKPHTTSPQLRALAFAHAQVAAGVSEHPPGSNRGPEVDKWNTAAGIGLGPSSYWCQSFADATLVAAGGPQIVSAYTVAVVQWARAGEHGLVSVFDVGTGHGRYEDRRAGDWIYFRFPGVSHDFCDHVGVLDSDRDSTIEGNTSPGPGGSQNNGGVVAVHQRGPAYVVAVVRPPYPKA
jgi:hypothetical protein